MEIGKRRTKFQGVKMMDVENYRQTIRHCSYLDHVSAVQCRLRVRHKTECNVSCVKMQGRESHFADKYGERIHADTERPRLCLC